MSSQRRVVTTTTTRRRIRRASRRPAHRLSSWSLLGLDSGQSRRHSATQAARSAVEPGHHLYQRTRTPLLPLVFDVIIFLTSAIGVAKRLLLAASRSVPTPVRAATRRGPVANPSGGPGRQVSSRTRPPTSRKRTRTPLFPSEFDYGCAGLHVSGVQWRCLCF